jgi:hypothetical protein
MDPELPGYDPAPPHLDPGVPGTLGVRLEVLIVVLLGLATVATVFAAYRI